MKLMKTIILIIFCISCSFLVSCKSTPEEKIDSVYVMVYDYDNNGVMDAVIYLENKMIGSTDIYGRFMFPVPSNSKNEISVKIEKTGYEKSELKTLLQEGQVLYFKIGSASYYAENAEKSFDDGKYETASSMIEKAILIEDRADYRYLQKLIQKRKVINESKEK